MQTRNIAVPVNPEVQALKARLREAQKLFALPLSEDEAKAAHRVHRELTEVLDPFALDKAIESVLQGRREKWEKSDG